MTAAQDFWQKRRFSLFFGLLFGAGCANIYMYFHAYSDVRSV